MWLEKVLIALSLLAGIPTALADSAGSKNNGNRLVDHRAWRRGVQGQFWLSKNFKNSSNKALTTWLLVLGLACPVFDRVCGNSDIVLIELQRQRF